MIGNDNNITINIGAFFDPTNTRKKKTNVAVGTAFKVVIIDYKKKKKKLKLPAIIPQIKTKRN